MKIIAYKTLIIFLTVSVFTSILIFPKKTEAGIPVFDSANLGGKLTDISEKIARWVKEDLVKSLRDVIAKRIIDYIVDQTIVWIQGGGQPKFVTDWDGFLKDAANIAFDQVIKDVGLAQLCSPFKLQVQISLLPVQQFQQRIDCTLDDVVKNIEDFYNDFEKGGWIAYNETWQPQGNYYGEMLMIHDEMITRGALAKEAAEKEALAGKGFLSVKKCLEQDEEGTCIKEEIVTPGDTVGVAVASAITSDTQWAANIQSWTAALINAVINRVIKEGVGVMKGSEESSGSSYYPSEYQSAADLEIESEKQQQINEVKKFVNEWQYLYNAKSKSLSYSEQLKVILVKIKKLNCQPAVSDSEIQAVQADIDRLKTETTELKNKIDGGNNLITKITNANTIRERTIAQQDFLAFVDKYNTLEIQTQIITGDARKAADQELATKTSDLSIAQGRLATCSISP
ncbi:hypothetical protein COW77_02195 [Candidatus Wolfebacteria bacterium CG18_big_fil_WC_8_21_14_2_50_39_7]|uniref:Uncharacterized protein n=3 Tax=Candidatus Wolfeibacteriota TaxID=1752735 RepID=A0A2H0EC72_9BACT|nr:hypothetical protein [Candidatus Wolfebacteria bacterium]OIO65222.1 MAG: hypothetical protein AUJ30_01355 [Candidatus Wolfebacteria bacterium CG1_02_39_135]PIP92033.1 MAG: hypothetical protein COW77_02195 [Candidatus Wolfebacteria bacterium CG18_big_fil_WC_8_21_14_2_50_39_7]